MQLAPTHRMTEGRLNWFGRDPAWKDVLGFRGRRDVEKPAGEWNRQEVIADGASITSIVNGVVVAKATASSHTAGKIQIQSEGAEIFVRSVELRPSRADARGTGVARRGAVSLATRDSAGLGASQRTT